MMDWTIGTRYHLRTARGNRENERRKDDRMKLVVCSHKNDGGKYLFRVPEGRNLSAGDAVIVKTKYGEQQAVCVTGAFQADGNTLEMVREKFGAPKEIKPVLAKIDYLEVWREDENE